MSPTRYKRILLKLSGEALASPNGFGVDPHYAMGVVSTISKLSQAGVQIAIVVGGGNYLRGGKSNFKNTINVKTSKNIINISIKNTDKVCLVPQVITNKTTLK